MSDPLANDNEVLSSASDEAARRKHDLKIQATKQFLTEWIEDNRRPGDGGTIIIALLELGLERHLDRFDDKSAADLVQGVLRKVVQRRRGPLQ